MRSFEKLTSLKEYIPIKKKEGGEKNIGLLVDGPNMLRKEFSLNLDLVRKILSEYGNMRVGKVLLNQYASDKLIEAIVNQGFTPIVVAGDTDVYMAVEAMELIYNPNIDIIALMTRDADFLPIINKAKENGKDTLVIGAEPGFSAALQNSADHAIILKSENSRAKRPRPSEEH
ncbi:TIGR00288 family NYN domain-containing protein [Methanothermobacter wolfeii]|uniref:TIGR00288 family NYN domain-containing protein n=1 Tax=Methanothermobacter wolfeii TaxID=145261 RepID=UPI0024B38CF2|nr:TIGR00288 family NYN domain-containing protein [Methanothermobacter wolfeii]MDI6702355.1 TIGR00288 family NYN domain-containing protein [Methanothermobacter wolfeii]MDI6841476.1 TIGR00288 family NYN domain-containing protein [Methanothermobacter wolfeii]